MFAEEAPLISKNIPSSDSTRLRLVVLFRFLFFFSIQGVFSHESRKLSREKMKAFHPAPKLRCAAVFFFLFLRF